MDFRSHLSAGFNPVAGSHILARRAERRRVLQQEAAQARRAAALRDRQAKGRADVHGGSFAVAVEPDGSVVIHARAHVAACLAGRDGFGDREALQAELQEHIADAWYAAGCPPEIEPDRPLERAAALLVA